MAGRRLTFREAVEAAAKHIPSVWNAEEKLNETALARYYENKGYPITQPTLHRLLTGKHSEPSPRVVEATYHVLGVPRSMLRGDPMPADIEKMLGDYHLSTLFLAKKLEALPRAVRKGIEQQIEAAFEQEEQLKHALLNRGNVTSFDREKPPHPHKP